MTKSTNQLSFINIEDDFTEEEESVFSTSPKRSVGTTTVGTTPSVPTMEEAIISKYQSGMPVVRLMKQYGMSTTILYKILDKYNVPLRGARNQYTNPQDEVTPVAETSEIKIDKEGVTVSRTITINIPVNSKATTLVINLEGGSN